MIRLKDVEMEYPNGTRAIRGISAAIEDGEFVFLVGPSGSGKSTIIKMLTGEEVPTAGRIMINGFSVSNIAASPHDAPDAGGYFPGFPPDREENRV